MAISQGSNLINVVVHNSADSRNTSVSAIILSHVLAEGEYGDSRPPKSPSSPCAKSCRGRLVTRRATDRKREEGRRLLWGRGAAPTVNIISC